jgi:hypothetical protein
LAAAALVLQMAVRLEMQDQILFCLRLHLRVVVLVGALLEGLAAQAALGVVR